MKTYRLLILSGLCTLLCLSSSCLRLDDNLFNPDTTITKYEFDNYTGKVDFTLPAAYDIPQQLVNQLDLTSQTPGESQTYKIKAVYVGDINRIKTDTVILYCHGNRHHMDSYWPRVKLLANTGAKNRYGVLTFDYRGYGLSEGEPSEAALYADVNAALAWLKQNGLSDSRLVIYGFSMGTAPATKVAAAPSGAFAMKPAKLILEAPFASAAVMVQDGSRLAIPGKFVTDLKIENAEEIKNVKQPFLWIHGVNDAFLSIKTHGELVYKNYGGNRSTAIRVAGADHSDVPAVMGFSQYLAAIKAFLKS